MKKLISISSFLVAILLSTNSFGQSNRQTTISGIWERSGPTELSLYRVLPGRLERIETFQLGEDKAFLFTFTADTEGYYVIGTGVPSTKLQKYTFYLKPGDHLSFIVNNTGYKLTGENTKENMAMAAWHEYILPLERSAYYPPFRQPLDEIFPLLEREPHVAKITGNKTFDESFVMFRKFDLADNAIRVLMMPRGGRQDVELPDFFKTLRVEDFAKTSDISMYPYSLLTNILWIENRVTGRTSSPNPIADLMNIVKNDTIKGELFLSNLSFAREILVMDELIRLYGSYIVTDDQRTRFQELKKHIAELQAASDVGKPGSDFTYQDINGNEVSFSDFRGKIVYIDVWATWCAPCRAEIPHLKKLKEHFYGNENLVIVGISIDAPRDIQKWKDFVAKENLGGIQLHSNSQSPDHISKLYSITGIPRFLLFDREGKIISLNAPKPSSPELIPLLTRLLE